MTASSPVFRVLVAVGVLASAVGGLLAQPHATGRLSPTDQATCHARRGTVVRGGLLNQEGCVLRFGDAGRACTDGRQCKGVCEYHGSWPPKAGKAAGQCSISSSPFGCHSILVDGHPSAPMCVD